MKLFRFMSLKEFEKYATGQVLMNKTDHNKDNNQKTNSVGFCFFNYAHYKPEEMLHSLTGIVTLDVCCIFETKIKNVHKSYGRYSRAKSKDIFIRESFIATEFCTTEYSNKDFKLLEYAEPNWLNWEKWDWIKP